MITDIPTASSSDGTATPSGEPGDDFFSSWDKPTIKRPSQPPSRTQTPPVISRTGSPFLNPGANGSNGARAKTPLSATSSEFEKEQAPTASRTISSSAIRKTPAGGAPRKANVLGAKKTQKLGAKKITPSDGIDFEAAEKKAKEEAERIEKLGYDPEAENVVEPTKTDTAAPIKETKIVAPTPISPPKGGFGATQGHQRSPSEVERLGMGMGRLGFGQVGGGKSGSAAPKKMGFGSVGAAKSAEAGEILLLLYGSDPLKS